MRIVAHTLVKNEENFIWYAINSVIDYVDEVMVWDNGSIDNTVSIIKSIKNSKINFRQVSGEVSILRQKMLGETHADWIVILDGDEVWWDEAINNLQLTINNLQKKDVVVISNRMLIGDIFHYQEEKAGKYRIAGREGHYNIRAIRKTSGLRLEGIYPNEAYVTKEGVKMQDLPKNRILFFDKPCLHASFLKRSSKDRKKLKHEIGEEFPKDFFYPEVFFRPRLSLVPSPWFSMGLGYKLDAFWQTPLKKLKRRII